MNGTIYTVTVRQDTEQLQRCNKKKKIKKKKKKFIQDSKRPLGP